MRWKLLGLLPLVHADGPEVTRSAVGRAAAEAVWVPTALLPRFGVDWSAADPGHITARYRIDTVKVEIHYVLDAGGHLTSMVFTAGAIPRAPAPGACTRSGARSPPTPPSTACRSPAPGGSDGSSAPTDGARASSSVTRSPSSSS